MTIEEIYNSEDLSIRSLNICNDNGLNDLSSLIDYYNKYKTFNGLKNCGNKSNEELVEICTKYIDYSNKEELYINTTEREKLNAILHSKFSKLTNKSKNSLRKYLKGTIEIDIILIKILLNKNFNLLNLKYTGPKSRYEINDFLNEIIYSIKHEIGERCFNKFILEKEIKDSNHHDIVLTSLTRKQKDIVNNFIFINFNNLTNRNKNALNEYLNGNIKIINIGEKILSNKEFNIKEIKNVGTKSTTELKTFIGSIKNFVENVSNTKDENELISKKNKFFIEKCFSNSEIPNDIINSLSIFKLTDYLILNKAIFHGNQDSIFQKAFKIYKDSPEINLDDISEDIKLSRERVRQIRKDIMEDLFNKLKFLVDIEDNLYHNYKIEINQNLIFIDEIKTNLINGINNTNFTKEFVSYIIYVHNSNVFSLIGNLDNVLLQKYINSREHHNWEHFYLVNKEINSVFDFNKFVDDIFKRLNERIEETYKFNFKSYLSNFMTSSNFDVIETVIEIAEKIVNSEFGINLDLEENILFSRNSVKQTYEYSYEALKYLGKPAKINEITNKILELHPDYEIDDAKVRASVKRKYGFVPISRTSVFGLKIWENELENFKGGTIRSIVMEYLEKQTQPLHISIISLHVLKFRPKSNTYSILQNLKLEDSGVFIFFKNSYVGLSNKDYERSYIIASENNYIEKKNWEERYSDLVSFLNQHNRLPFSSGCSENEIKLYRWYKVQRGKTKKAGLGLEKTKLITEVFENYEHSLNQKRRKKNIDKYDELISFVIKQKRLPSANYDNEVKLYHFFHKQRKFYYKGQLRSDEEQNFNKLATIIQKQKNENQRDSK